ncbi:hypothetical protein [Saccharopolyspora sp. NPDC002376]
MTRFQPKPKPKLTPFQISLFAAAVLCMVAQGVVLASQPTTLGFFFQLTAVTFLSVAMFFRGRQIEDHEREDGHDAGENPGGKQTPEEEHLPRRSDSPSLGVKVVFSVELALALLGGALHQLQIEAVIGLKSLTATTLLLSGAASIAFGLLVRGLLRRFGMPGNPTDALAALGSLAVLPPLFWLGFVTGKQNGPCALRYPDGSIQEFACIKQESGDHSVVDNFSSYLGRPMVDDISSYLGWPMLGFGIMTAIVIGAAFAISHPDRGNSAFLKLNLVCAVLISAIMGTSVALGIADPSKPEKGWTLLAVLIVILPPAIHAFRRRAQLERARKAGLRLRR